MTGLPVFFCSAEAYSDPDPTKPQADINQLSGAESGSLTIARIKKHPHRKCGCDALNYQIPSFVVGPAT